MQARPPSISGAHFSQSRSALLLGIAAIVLSIGLLLLPALVKLDGQPHADWQQFLGRLHPLAVHIPIGLIVLVPILEVAGRFRSALREAAGFVLMLACLATLGSLTLGYLLAYGSGDSGTTLKHHMWGGILLSIGMLLCVLARAGFPMGRAFVYPSLLTCVLLTLTYTAHQGGSLTHGDNYLTAYMPVDLKRLLPSGSSAAVAGNSFYAQHVHPIFDSNCVSCHGASKTQGGLRLDTYDLLMKGGSDGPVVIPRDASQSMLLARILLPPGDPHFMPAEGRPPLKAEQIAWIRAWIQQGASSTVLNLNGIAIASSVSEPAPAPVGDYRVLMPQIEAMQHAQGAKLYAVSANPADGLILSTIDAPLAFGDTQLAQFKDFAPFIVEADLARTAVTDASLDTLAHFPHLRTLHLEGTSITGHSLAKLTALPELKYLNLSDTKVDTASIAALSSMQSLHHIYLFNTPAQPSVSSAATPAKSD